MELMNDDGKKSTTGRFGRIQKKKTAKKCKSFIRKCVNSFSIQSSSVFMAILAIFFPDCLLAWFCENVNILK